MRLLAILCLLCSASAKLEISSAGSGEVEITYVEEAGGDIYFGGLQFTYGTGCDVVQFTKSTDFSEFKVKSSNDCHETPEGCGQGDILLLYPNIDGWPGFPDASAWPASGINIFNLAKTEGTGGTCTLENIIIAPSCATDVDCVKANSVLTIDVPLEDGPGPTPDYPCDCYSKSGNYYFDYQSPTAPFASLTVIKHFWYASGQTSNPNYPDAATILNIEKCGNLFLSTDLGATSGFNVLMSFNIAAGNILPNNAESNLGKPSIADYEACPSRRLRTSMDVKKKNSRSLSSTPSVSATVTNALGRYWLDLTFNTGDAGIPVNLVEFNVVDLTDFSFQLDRAGVTCPTGTDFPVSPTGFDQKPVCVSNSDILPFAASLPYDGSVNKWLIIWAQFTPSDYPYKMFVPLTAQPSPFSLEDIIMAGEINGVSTPLTVPPVVSWPPGGTSIPLDEIRAVVGECCSGSGIDDNLCVTLPSGCYTCGDLESALNGAGGDTCAYPEDIPAPDNSCECPP